LGKYGPLGQIGQLSQLKKINPASIKSKVKKISSQKDKVIEKMKAAGADGSIKDAILAEKDAVIERMTSGIDTLASLNELRKETEAKINEYGGIRNINEQAVQQMMTEKVQEFTGVEAETMGQMGDFSEESLKTKAEQMMNEAGMDNLGEGSEGSIEEKAKSMMNEAGIGEVSMSTADMEAEMQKEMAELGINDIV